MDLYLSNTISGQKDRFKPAKAYDTKVYTCGPTVYNYAHIWNLRTYIFEDLLMRSLRYFDYRPTQVMNLTDIDDKTIRESHALDKDLLSFTQYYTDAFIQDIQALNIQKPDKLVRVTDYIDTMISMVQKLLDSGYAYVSDDGSVYYDIQQFPEYGKLSGFDVSELKSGARVSQDEFDKENAGDFVLWKAWNKEDGENFYTPSFTYQGERHVIKGRPGWHLECSAVNEYEFGGYIDIHCGAVDNIFPHHECEIAQSEACHKTTFAHYWVHAQHLMVGGKKMAKSAGNFYTLRDIVSLGYTPRAFRYLCLQTHYKSPMNLELENLPGAEEALKRMDRYLAKIQEKAGNDQAKEEATDMLFAQNVLWYNRDILEAMADDLNAPEALASLHALMDQFPADELTTPQAQFVEDVMQVAIHILGLDLHPERLSQEVPKEVFDLAQKRKEAKQAKDYETADVLRDEIASLGYIVKDTQDGYEFEKK